MSTDVIEPQELLRVLPREMKLLAERILLITAVPAGLVESMVEVVLHSQCLGLGGFRLLEERFSFIRNSNPLALRILAESGPRLHFDACEQHSWTVLPSILDFAAAQVASGPSCTILVDNAIDASEMATASALGPQRGIAVDAIVMAATGSGHSSVKLRVSQLSRNAEMSLLERAAQNGEHVDAALWWRLYKLSNTALHPDSAVSRRHAGPMIVMDDGRLIGRSDNEDEADISFISTTGSSEQEQGNSPA